MEMGGAKEGNKDDCFELCVGCEFVNRTRISSYISFQYGS